MAIFDGKPRMASVHTITPSKLLVLRANYGDERTGDRFRDFLQQVPDLRKRLKQTTQLRNTQSQLTRTNATDRSRQLQGLGELGRSGKV